MPLQIPQIKGNDLNNIKLELDGLPFLIIYLFLYKIQRTRSNIGSGKSVLDGVQLELVNLKRLNYQI